MMDGWFKMHRKIIESPVFEDPEMLKMWVWILCKASHRERAVFPGKQTVLLKEGEFVFGRKSAANSLNMSESKVYRILNALKESGMVEVKANNKFSVVNVVNWGFYQGSDGCQRTANEQQTNSQRTSNEQQTNTNKNYRINNYRIKEKRPVSSFGLPLPIGMTMEEFEEQYRQMKAGE